MHNSKEASDDPIYVHCAQRASIAPNSKFGHNAKAAQRVVQTPHAAFGESIDPDWRSVAVVRESSTLS